MVEGYHSGFNKSIHNYSQILRLFTESKMQVSGSRRGRRSGGGASSQWLAFLLLGCLACWSVSLAARAAWLPPLCTYKTC